MKQKKGKTKYLKILIFLPNQQCTNLQKTLENEEYKDFENEDLTIREYKDFCDNNNPIKIQDDSEFFLTTNDVNRISKIHLHKGDEEKDKEILIKRKTENEQYEIEQSHSFKKIKM